MFLGWFYTFQFTIDKMGFAPKILIQINGNTTKKYLQ